MVRLPVEYQEVEYLESSGTQYIDTGRNLYEGSIISIDFYITESSVNRVLYGWRRKGTYKQQYQLMIGASYLKRRYIAYGASSEVTGSDFDFNTINKVIIDSYNKHIYINGEIVNCRENFGSDRVFNTDGSSELNPYLFTFNSIGSVPSAMATDIKIYKYSVKYNGDLIQNFIPCYRKSDSEPGMYDTVSGTFFTNAGTGTFIVGNDVSWDTASLIERRRQILLNSPHLETISDSMASFNTDVPAPLKSCKIYFEPVQEGTGDPSPDNVRPISGWDGVELHINNTSLTIPFPQTIYGGYVDLVKGEVVETWQKVVLDGDETPNAGSNYNGSLGTNRYFIIPSTGLGYNVGSGYCETAKFQRGAIWASPDSHLGEFNINTAQLYVVFTNATVGITSEMTVNEKTATIKTWLASNPMTFVVPLATPITHQLTPETIRALRGVNNVWSNANGNIEIGYWGH